MEVSGEARIPAPREQVWAALNDADVLKRCIPGCQSLEKTADDAFAATATLKVGAVKATFRGTVTLTNVDPPNGYTIAGEGQGGAAGFARGEADVRLEDDGDETVLRYRARATVGGKLAQVGQRLLHATAQKLAGQFFDAFAEVVAGPPEAAEEAVPASAQPIPAETAERAPEAALPTWAWVVGVLVVVAALLALFGL